MPAWSPQQDAALKAVHRWMTDAGVFGGRPGPQRVFRLFGYAGTGKTTLARHLAEGVEGNVAFAAYTGKAALVMRAKGCAGATTIHALIYRPRGVAEDDDNQPTFALNRQSAAGDARLIIVDECSMVDEELGRDLLSFGAPVLVLGDPGQLPPVKGGGFFTEVEPDVMLTEVHRQARDNPIVALSMLAREGGRLAPGAYGDSRVVTRAELDRDAVLDADQVLVGLNKTRRAYNARLRDLKGLPAAGPAPGDKLVCLRNDSAKGLLNGGLWRVREVATSRRGLFTMRIAPDEEGAGRTTKVSVMPEFFEGREETIPPALRRHSDAFDYGYALTVHKSQGSQWDAVALFDESHAFREHRARWLYTGLTRAAARVLVVT